MMKEEDISTKVLDRLEIVAATIEKVGLIDFFKHPANSSPVHSPALNLSNFAQHNVLVTNKPKITKDSQ